MQKKRKSRKKTEKIEIGEQKVEDFNEQLTESVSGLFYLSETDAEIFVVSGKQKESLTKDSLLIQIARKNEEKIEEKDFNEFFEPLCKMHEWFGVEEKQIAERFFKLKELLQQNLHDLKVFRIGKKEIDIYVVGLDKENILRGIQTKAVET